MEKLSNDEKFFIGVGITAGVGIIGKIIYECLPSTKEKRKKQEMKIIEEQKAFEKHASEFNASVESDLSKLKTFSQGELISKIISSNDITSGLKGEIIKIVKTGKNSTDDNINKAIFKTAVNPKIGSTNTLNIIDSIMNSHPKTESEIICDTINDVSDKAMKLISKKLSSPKTDNSETNKSKDNKS